MRADRLLEVRQLIVEHRTRFKYSAFMEDTGNRLAIPTAGELLRNCNTMGCVAGWTCALFAPDADVRVGIKAEEALELSSDESKYLFYGQASFGEAEIELSRADVTTALHRIDVLLSLYER